MDDGADRRHPPPVHPTGPHRSRTADLADGCAGLLPGIAHLLGHHGYLLPVHWQHAPYETTDQADTG